MTKVTSVTVNKTLTVISRLSFPGIHTRSDIPVNRGEESSSSKCAVNSRRRTGNVAIGPIGIDHAPVHNTCPGRCPGRRPGKRGPTAQPPNLEEDFENQDWNVMVETWSKSSADNVPGTDYDGNEGLEKTC